MPVGRRKMLAAAEKKGGGGIPVAMPRVPCSQEHFVHPQPPSLAILP